jgi:hypothetical protein
VRAFIFCADRYAYALSKRHNGQTARPRIDAWNRLHEKQNWENLKMRKVLIIALGLASLGALANVQPAFAVQKQVCNWTVFNGQTTRQTAQCLKYGGCTVTHPVSALAAKKTCFYVEVQPGAPSVTGSTNSSTHLKAN